MLNYKKYKRVPVVLSELRKAARLYASTVGLLNAQTEIYLLLKPFAKLSFNTYINLFLRKKKGRKTL